MKNKIEKYILEENAKNIWLILYTSSQNEPSCDIVENKKELLELVKYHKQHTDNYRVVELIKGAL